MPSFSNKAAASRAFLTPLEKDVIVTFLPYERI